MFGVCLVGFEGVGRTVYVGVEGHCCGSMQRGEEGSADALGFGTGLVFWCLARTVFFSLRLVCGSVLLLLGYGREARVLFGRC